MLSNQLKGYLCGIVSSSTFGLIPLFVMPALNAGIGLNSVMLYRFGISALCLGLYLLIRRQNLRINLKEFIVLFFLGTFYALTALFLTVSYLYIPTGVATTIHFLYPMVVSAIMIFIFKEKASSAVIFASLLALGGVFLLSGGLDGNINLKGIALVLSTVVTYALYIVGVNKSIVSSMDGLKMTFWVLFCAAIVFILNLLIRRESFDMVPDMNIGISLFLLAIIPTLVSDFTLILSVQKIGSTTTAILGCMEPVTAVIVGTLVFHESMEFVHILGVGIILLAVTLVILKSDKTRNSELITD